MSDPEKSVVVTFLLRIRTQDSWKDLDIYTVDFCFINKKKFSYLWSINSHYGAFYPFVNSNIIFKKNL